MPIQDHGTYYRHHFHLSFYRLPSKLVSGHVSSFIADEGGGRAENSGCPKDDHDEKFLGLLRNPYIQNRKA
jgi:hypothetical protein